MKYKYNNEWKEMNVKVSDTLPIGSVVEYDGESIPSGWEEVEDTGSNANGNWIKYTNGVMICWTTKQGESHANATRYDEAFFYQQGAYSSTSPENSKSWTYPVEFISAPTVNAVVGSSAHTITSVNSVSETSMGASCVTPYAVDSVTFRWYFMAIGRWK